MVTKAPILTNAGQNLLIRALSGEQITFSRFKAGNGTLSDQSEAELTDLINPLLSFGIIDVDDSNEGYIGITGKFDSTDVEVDFQLRELGLFAYGEDEVEVLYCYVNDGENGGLLKAESDDVLAEQNLTFVIAIGQAEHVYAIMSEGVLYATKAELEAHTQNFSNPHGVTKTQVGLGNVPNVATNDQTPTFTVAEDNTELVSGEKLGTAFGKIAKAIRSLVSHLTDTNNPHNVTRQQLSAASSVHTHSAADITSGKLSLVRGGTGATSAWEGGFALQKGVFRLSDTGNIIDANDAFAPGIYSLGLTDANIPVAGHQYYIFTIATGSSENYSSRRQIAIDIFNNSVHSRQYSILTETWSSWS